MDEFISQIIYAACVNEQEGLAKHLGFTYSILNEEFGDGVITSFRKDVKTGIENLFVVYDIVLSELAFHYNWQGVPGSFVTVEGLCLDKNNPAVKILRDNAVMQQVISVTNKSLHKTIMYM